jgi:hypothetical protein
MRSLDRRRSFKPLLIGAVATYGLAVAAWLAAIDWS